MKVLRFSLSRRMRSAGMCVVGWPGERPDRRLSWSNPSWLSWLRWVVADASRMRTAWAAPDRGSDKQVSGAGRRRPADADAQSARKTAAGHRAPRTVIFHSPVRLRRDRRPARSDIQCPNDSPLRHRSDVVQTFRCPNACRNVGANPLQGLGNLASDSPNPCLNSSLDNLSPSKRERVQTGMSEREGRAGRDRSIRIAGQAAPGTAGPSLAISHLRLSR
jgi:hypothetical protein